MDVGVERWQRAGALSSGAVMTPGTLVRIPDSFGVWVVVRAHATSPGWIAVSPRVVGATPLELWVRVCDCTLVPGV